MNERETEPSLNVSARSAFAGGGGLVSAPFSVSEEEESSHASHRCEEGPVLWPSGEAWEAGERQVMSPDYK